MDRRLDERTVGDRFGDAKRFVARAGTANIQRDEVGRSLSVADDRGGELRSDVIQQCLEFRPAVGIERTDPGCSVGQQDDRIARAGVPFDADAVETLIDRLPQG